MSDVISLFFVIVLTWGFIVLLMIILANTPVEIPEWLERGIDRAERELKERRKKSA